VASAAFQMELSPTPLPARTDLAVLPFAVVLANARMQALTGMLDLRGEKRIYFSRGEPVSVESDLVDESTEAYVVRVGAVDASDVPPARDLAHSKGGKLSDALLGLGLLEPNEVFEHAKNRARDTLITCFQGERGSVMWEALPRLGPSILQVPVDVVRVFFDGISRFYDRRRLDRELPVEDSSRLFVVKSRSIDAASIGTVEARLMNLAAGHPSVASAAFVAGLSGDDLRRRLYALYCLGVIGFEMDAPYEKVLPPEPSPPPPTHLPRVGTGSRPVVDLGPGPTPDAQDPPPPAQRRSVPPPVPRPTTRPSTAPPLPPTASAAPRPGTAPPATRPSTAPPRPGAASGAPRPGTAPPATRPDDVPAPTPRPPPRGGGAVVREVVEISKATKTTAEYLEDAEMARSARDWDAALLALEHALDLDPVSPTVWAEKAYTLLLRDPRAGAKEANQLARDSRRDDPGLPLPYLVQGMLMEQVGEVGRATHLYRVALQRDPLCEPAQKLLEAIQERARR
jgi:hypothetical protein